MTRLALILCMLLPTAAHADVLRIPVGSQGESAVQLPARGERSQAVLQRFGLPDEEHPAVGTPPITRWDYRDFSVYFESGVVINSVDHHRPRQPLAPAEGGQP